MPGWRAVPKDKREDVLRLRADDPERSIRSIAREVGLHHDTVGSIIKEAEGSDEVRWVMDRIEQMSADLAAFRGDMLGAVQRIEENSASVLAKMIDLMTVLVDNEKKAGEP